MAGKSNFIVRGGADFSEIKKEMQKTQKLFQGFQGKINGIMKIAGVAVGAKALIDFGKQAIGVASDLTEVQNVVDVTFGKMSKDINKFANNALEAYGLSELSAKKYASTMGAMLKSSGLAGQQMKDMSKDLTALSADMASFYNLSNDVAFDKIRSGISGQTEPLKQLGINMSVANLEAFNMSQGIKKAWKEMTQAEQVLTRYNYLINVSKDAQGDFARNTGTWANQTKILKERWQEFMGLIGSALIEIGLPVVKALNAILSTINSVLKKIGQLYTIITGKKIIAEANTSISDSAEDAADSELDLSSGIDKAAKAAKRALAPFDELNVLQNGLGDGDGLGGSGINIGSIGNISTDIKEAESGVDGLKKKFDDFFFMLDDRNKDGFFKQPVKAPEVQFAEIPDPVYVPNWGLELPPMPIPEFKPVVAPAIDLESYFNSSKLKYLQPITAPYIVSAIAPTILLETFLKSKKDYQLTISPPTIIQVSVPAILLYSFLESKKQYQETIEPPVVEPVIIPALETATFYESLNKLKEDYKTTIEYIRDITTPTLFPAGVAFAVLFDGISKNTVNWGNNEAKNYQKTLNYIPTTTALALGAAAIAFNNFFKGTDANTINWGDALVKKIGKVGEGVYKNFVGALIAAKEQFVGFMEMIGEKISNWWSGNKNWAAPVLAGGLAAAAIGGIVISGGTLAPAMGALTPAIAAIPGLATGAVIPPNSEFLAILGDQKSGTNIEAPLTTIEQALRNVLNERGGQGERVIIEVPVYFDSDIIGRISAEWIDGQVKRTGSLPFSLGNI